MYGLRMRSIRSSSLEEKTTNQYFDTTFDDKMYKIQALTNASEGAIHLGHASNVEQRDEGLV